jgi:hypothetical protein
MPSIILDGSDYKVTVSTAYYLDATIYTYYSFFSCSIADGTAVEYKIETESAKEIGAIVNIGTNLCSEFYDVGGTINFTGLYASSIADPTSTSLVVDPSRDPTYAPWLAAVQEDLGLFISDQGVVVEVSTGSILYTITELSDYFGNALARTLKTV